jgi:hypothetical protein
VHINLHLTDDTELRAHGFVADSGLFAEVHWDFPIAGSRLGEGALWAPQRGDAPAGRPGRPGGHPGRGGGLLAGPPGCHQGVHAGEPGRMNRLLDAALGYAARGTPVYPVHWPRPIPGGAGLACSCRRGATCDRPAKHPLVRHGLHDATCDPGQLERWWSRWPQANVGLATGVVFDALDIDGPEGLAALRQLQEAVGLRLPGPLVATGGGGWHHWFCPTGLGNRPPRDLTHVDWRGKGGCVLAPPSRHSSGRTYRWVRDLDQAPLPEVPAALRLLLDPDPPTTTRPTRTAGPDMPGHPYGQRVLAAELAALGRATPGQRNHVLNRTAFKVYRYVASGVLPDDEVTAAFTEIARAIGLSAAETSRTLASARTAGLANPRTVPTGLGPSPEEAGR